MRVLNVTFSAFAILAVAATANGQGFANQFPGVPPAEAIEAPPFEPAPRGPDGRALLTAPEESGIWVGGITSISVTSHDEVPYQPWAENLVTYRRSSPLEPHTRCKPSGGPRQWLTPYGAEIVEMPDLGRVYIFDIGGPHTYRTIYMDATSHPEDLIPSYYGHSIGRWEGDTLVIDSVGYNERFWMDRGRTPHTSELHMIERLTRTSLHDIKYEITIDDPGAYTDTWTGEMELRWLPDEELFEYMCQDNNRATDIMIGAGPDVDRSRIVP